MSDGYGALGALQPGGWPTRPALSRSHRGHLARRAALWIILIGVTFGQRFCFPYATFQIPLSVPLAYIGLYLLLSSGQLRINTMGFMLYALTIGLMITTLFFDKASFSPFSFFYLIVLYLVYIFSIDVSREEHLKALNIYQTLLVPLAVIALFQLVGQMTSGSTWTIFDYIPRDYWLTGYNTRPVLNYGSTFHKSNAEFFLEPSFLSQYMALGMIIEILYFGRWKRLALYAAAIFASFSGTGMALLLVFAAATTIRARRWELLYALPLLLVAYYFFQDNEYVTAITGRVGEFDTDESSAFMRFIGPNAVVSDLILPHFGAFLVGKGPGYVEQLNQLAVVKANYPVIPKLLIEYGMFGLVPFLAFVTYRFFSGSRSRLLSAALFLMYLFLSGSLLQPHTIYLFYVLLVLMPAQAEERARRAPLPDLQPRAAGAA
jgi:hypothetical protein